MISQTDLELLNAYLDGALDESQRTDLESRLASEATLRRELASLRATSELVRGLPALRAPRDFTLTPADARRARTIAFPATAISFVSAAASILLILIGVSLLSPISPSSPSLQTAAEARTLERDDFADGSLADAAVAVLPTASPMPTQPPPSMAAGSGAAAAPPVAAQAQQNALTMTAVTDEAFFDSAATTMLEEVEAQATQIAGRVASTSNAAPVPNALAQPEQAAALSDMAGGIVAPSEFVTQTALYGIGADAFASEAPGYAESQADALESVALATETASATVTPSITLSPTPTTTYTPTLQPTPTIVDDQRARQQQTEIPTGAILIGIGAAIGILAVVIFVRARR